MKHLTIEQMIGNLEGFRKRDVPYIAMLSSNDWAFDVKRRIDREVKSRLHIRQRGVMSAVRIKRASKRHPQSTVYIDEWSWQHKVLEHHFTGGDRHRKGLEKSLIAHGMMSRGDILTPPPGVRIRPWVYVQMIAQLRVVYKQGYNANMTKKTKEKVMKRGGVQYFIITRHDRSHLAPGIYGRLPGGKLVNYLRIASQPVYQKRFESFEHQAIHSRDKSLTEYVRKNFNKVVAMNLAKGWA